MAVAHRYYSSCRAPLLLLITASVVVLILILPNTPLLSIHNNHNHQNNNKTNAEIMLEDQRQYVASWIPPLPEEIQARKIPVCLNITTQGTTTVMPTAQHVCLRRKWDTTDPAEGPVYLYQPLWAYGAEASIEAVVVVDCLTSGGEKKCAQTVLSYDGRAQHHHSWQMQYQTNPGDWRHPTPVRIATYVASVDLPQENTTRNNTSTTSSSSSSDYSRITHLMHGVEWKEKATDAAVNITVRDCDPIYYQQRDNDNHNDNTHSLIPDICYVDAEVHPAKPTKWYHDSDDNLRHSTKVLVVVLLLVLLCLMGAGLLFGVSNKVLLKNAVARRSSNHRMIEERSETHQRDNEFLVVSQKEDDNEVLEENDNDDGVSLFTRPSISW